MDNRNFFDPYAQFGTINTPPAYVPSQSTPSTNEYMGPAITPKEFYEQQEVYYRYLITMMDYNMKSREYEKLLRQEKSNNNSAKSI